MTSAWSRGRRRRKLLLTFVVSILLACFCFTSFVVAFRSPLLPRLAERDYARIQDVEKITAVIDARPIVNHRQTDSLLSKILIPRVPDSVENAKVRALLAAPFQRKDSRWTVEEHKFVAVTPEGEKHMTNLIITYNKDAPRKLVLAAHHDSKVSPKGFIGATDSAVPCAIIVDTALALEKLMEQQANGETKHERASETSLQLLFFDGEEAYQQWTDTDSVYGSRALAAQWAKSFFTPQLAKRRNAPGYTTMRTIDSIDHFVLLDLLGTPHPTIPPHFAATRWMHAELRDIERRLAAAGLLYPKDSSGRIQLPPSGGRGTPSLPAAPGTQEQGRSFFSSGTSGFAGGIDDDHRPFMQNGVPILHLIPSPFPSVWHRMSDNADALDYPTIYAWTMIMRVFVAEYFGLEVHNDNKPTRDDKMGEERSIIGRSMVDFVSV